jgi:hypothetical protein
MQRVEEHAPVSARIAMEQAVFYVCQRRAEFTTEAPRAVLRARGDPSPPEGRAWGSVMQNAARWGWCVPTDRTHKGVEAPSHRRDKRIWRSLRYSVQT